MKNYYQHWSKEALMHRKDALIYDIEQWEKVLENAKSFLIRYSLTHTIKRSREEIHAINAELCYREHNNTI